MAVSVAAQPLARPSLVTTIVHSPARRRPPVAGCRLPVPGRPTVLLLLLLALSGLAREGDAQDGVPVLHDYDVTAWTTIEGLPQNTVSDIAALQNGELWVATFGGLVRVDGERLHVVDIARDEGLPSNRMVALEAVGQDMWFLSQEGHLGRLSGGRARTEVVPAVAMPDALSLLHDGTRFLMQTSDGSVWRTDGRTAWARLYAAPPTEEGAFNAIARGPSGPAWVSLRHTVAKIDGDGLGPRLTPAAPIYATAADASGELWLGLDRAVARIDGARIVPLALDWPVAGPIEALLPLGRDAAWAATAGDVFLLERTGQTGWRRTRLPLNLPPDVHVRSLLLDQEESLWIGTVGHGLVRVGRQPVQRLGAESGLSGVHALVTDGKGGAWVSRDCNGLFHVDYADKVTAVRPPGANRPFPRCAQALAPDDAGGIWIRDGVSLFHMGPTPDSVRRIAVTLPRDSGPVVAAPDGSLWVVSRYGDVHRIAPGRPVEHHRLPAPLISAWPGTDDVWVGGVGVVHHLHGGTMRSYGAKEGMPRGDVRDILVQGDQVLVATYGGGLGVVRNGRVRRVTTDQGLPDNSISRVLDDGHGRLWIATNRGIAVVDREELSKVVAGERPALMPVVFGPDRGVAEANFGLPAGFAEPGGRLWFGTISSVVRLNAARFPFNTTPPPVRIERVLLDERAIPLTSVVVVPAGTGRVRLQFGSTSRAHPERLRFRFRFDGVDPDWVDAGAQRSAAMTPMGPGRQRFRLQARNEDGVWSDPPLVVELDVLPAWWQTTVARVGGALVMALAAFGLYRMRVGLLHRRHEAELTRLVEQRQREEQALALRSQLEHVSRLALAGELTASLAHEVNQPLTAIVANAEAGEHLLAAQSDASPQPELRDILHDIVVQGLRASDVVGELRKFLRAGSPDATPLDLSALVREMLPLVRRELAEHQVELSLDLATDLPPVDGRRVQLGQVVVNLLLNASEALSTIDGPRLVTVTTALRDDRVELTVRDNGPGIDPDVAERIFQPFVSTKPKGMGMGLAICRSIAEAHAGRLFAQATSERGATMVLSLPVAGSVSADAARRPR